MNQAKIRRHLDRLAVLDADLCRGLELVRYPKPRIRAPGFETLLSTIVSQQISTAAAKSIMAAHMETAWKLMRGQEIQMTKRFMQE